MSEESAWKSLPRILMIVGGAMALIFGLLSAFIPGLHYVRMVYLRRPFQGRPRIDIAYLPFKLQLHDYSLGMLLFSVGGLLGLISSLRRDNRLVSAGFAGSFLAMLGLFASAPRPPNWFPTSILFEMWWLGSCLAIVGVCVMFVGSMMEFRGWHSLSVLGVPFLLCNVLLFQLLAATRNFDLLSRILAGSVNIYGITGIIGLSLTLLGSAIGVWKFLPNLRHTTHAS